MFGKMSNRFVVGVVTLALALSLVEVTEASQGGESKAGGGKAGTSNTVAKCKGGSKGPHYHILHGTKFKHGYYFKGKAHRHWSYCYWNACYRCYFFYEPDLSSYYYWCASQNCYYPVTYIATAPPVAGDVFMPAGIEIKVIATATATATATVTTTVTTTATATATATAIVGSGATARGPK
jgi:hypothetical protein